MLKDAIYGQVNKTEIDDNFKLMKLYCQQNNSEYVISQEDYVISIPCQEILNGTSDTIVNLQIDKFIQANYYKKYECSFWQCFKKEKTPFFIISETSKNYFKNKFYSVLIISLALIALIFFLVEFKRNTLIITGSLLIISGLPFAKSNIFTNLITNENITSILSMIFTQGYKISLITLVLGILMIEAGIALKIFSIKKENKE